jgi:hemoglobin
VQGDVTLYEAVGGMPFFEALVDRFYEGVSKDPVLLRLYPEPEDLSEARRKLALFLGQYWGGPPAYTRDRGHPALRMRHAPFAIGMDERDRWLAHMLAALDAMEPGADVVQALRAYLESAADALRNVDTGP